MAKENLLRMLKEIDGNSDVAEVTHTFRLYRNLRGKNQEVTVQILDYGEDVKEHYRYQCFIRTFDGYGTVRNLESSPEYAIERIHWEHLERNSNNFWQNQNIERG